MPNYKLTVIIPAYNVEKYIDRCLISLANQVYKDFYVLIVDDASSDGTVEIIEKAVEKYENMEGVYLSENHGPSYCRNIGIRKVSTPFITFVDADDYIDVSTFEKCMNEDIANYDLLIYGLSYDYMQTDTIIKKYVYSKKFLVSGEYALKIYGHTIHDSFKITPIVNNKIYNTSLLYNNSIEFDENVRHQEDDTFTFRVLSKATSVLFVPDCFYHYCQNNSSLVHSPSEESIIHFIIAYKNLHNYLIKENIFTKYEDEFYLKFKSSLRGVIERTITYSNDITNVTKLLSILYKNLLENFDIEKLLLYYDFKRL